MIWVCWGEDERRELRQREGATLLQRQAGGEMESGEGRSKKGEMTARFHGDGICAAERRKSMMETVGSCRRDGPGKKGEWGRMHKEGRSSEGCREPVGEAGRKEGQARPEANPSIQMQKGICALTSPVM